jgi:hypothetical protein
MFGQEALNPVFASEHSANLPNLDAPQLEWSKYSEFRWINLDEIEILKEDRTPGDTLIYDVVKKG